MNGPSRDHPHRLSAEAYAEPNRVAFVTVNTKAKQPLLAGAQEAECVISALRHLVPQLIAYCVMPDHVHFVYVTTVGKPLPRVVSQVKGRTSYDLHRLGSAEIVWQRSYWDYYARDENALWPLIEYVLDNPVRRGFCERRDDWTYSGFCGLPW